MRYIDVVMMSRRTHGKAQLRRCSKTTRSCGSPAARRQEPARGCAAGRSAPTNRVSLARGAQCRWHRCLAGHEPWGTAGAAWRGRVVTPVCDAARRRSRARLCYAAVDTQTSPTVDRTRVWCAVQRGPRVALARPTGSVQPEARSARARARRGGNPALAQAHLAGVKKTPPARED